MANFADEESIGLRVNDLDATRATEQCALALALTAGRGGKRPGPGRGPKMPSADRSELFALQLILGYVGKMWCEARVGGFHFESKSEEAQKEFRSIKSELSKRVLGAWNTPEAQWKLDFLVAPVNCMADLAGGLPGVISAVAGGTGGSFVNSTYTSYLVIAGDPDLKLNGPIVPQGMACRELVEQCVAIDQERTVSSCLQSHKELQGSLPALGRLRVFTGSPIVGAIAALRARTGVDLFAAQVNHVEASMVAICALATRGVFVAIPLDPQGCAAGPQVGPDAFIAKNADVFLAATGITDSIVLRGVRFSGSDGVATQSMCLRTGTRSTRFVTHHHVLGDKRFRVWNNGSIETVDFEAIERRISAHVKRTDS